MPPARPRARRRSAADGRSRNVVSCTANAPHARAQKVKDILNTSRTAHVAAVQTRISSVGEMKDVEALTAQLFELSKQTAALEHETFSLRQKAALTTEVKSVLDAWVRHEAQVREAEQRDLVQTVLANVQKGLGDKKLQRDILLSSVAEIEGQSSDTRLVGCARPRAGVGPACAMRLGKEMRTRADPNSLFHSPRQEQGHLIDHPTLVDRNGGVRAGAAAGRSRTQKNAAGLESRLTGGGGRLYTRMPKHVSSPHSTPSPVVNTNAMLWWWDEAGAGVGRSSGTSRKVGAALPNWSQHRLAACTRVTDSPTVKLETARRSLQFRKPSGCMMPALLPQNVDVCTDLIPPHSRPSVLGFQKQRRRLSAQRSTRGIKYGSNISVPPVFIPRL